MMTGAIVAIALGLTPVNESSPSQVIRVDEAKIAAQIGHYKQSVGKDGKTHIRGYDRLGRPYDLTVDANGYVQGEAGNMFVTFHVKEAA